MIPIGLIVIDYSFNYRRKKGGEKERRGRSKATALTLFVGSSRVIIGHRYPISSVRNSSVCITYGSRYLADSLFSCPSLRRPTTRFVYERR